MSQSIDIFSGIAVLLPTVSHLKTNKKSTLTNIRRPLLFHSIPALRKCLITLSLSVLVLLFTTALHAQTNSSKLEGTVADAQGKMLVDASVTLQDMEGNVVKRALTDAQGAYSFTNVANGHYNLAVSATGFSTTQRAITAKTNRQRAHLA